MHIDEALIERAQQGDREAMSSVFKGLEGFLRTIVRRYSPTGYADSEDFMQCAYLALHSAVMKYDGQHDFLHLLVWEIQNECRTLLGIRSTKKRVETLSYDMPAPDGETPFSELIEDENLPVNDEVLMTEDIRRDVQAALETLEPRRRRIVQQHWFEGRTLQAISEDEGISAARAAQLHDDALEKLRRHMGFCRGYAEEFRHRR